MATLLVYQSPPSYLYCSSCGHVLNQQDSYAWGNTTEIFACPHTGCAQKDIQLEYPLEAIACNVLP